MNSEENLDEYGRNIKNDSDIIQNALSKRNYQSRRVSFPENDTDLVTGYLEPVNPFRLAINVDKSELLKAYEFSCQRHNTDPIQTVVDQIKNFNIGDDRISCFNLNKVILTCFGCESLEEIFKRVQFVYIDLTDCGLTSETASALFEMFEYYESTIHLNLSNNNDMDVRGWQACARYIKKSNSLEELETRDIRLTDHEADCLLKPLASNRHLQVLKLENCNLNGGAMRSLVNALTNNKTLKELYLADNKLGIFEATLLGSLLKLNKTLQVLDLSNNQIQDQGVQNLVLGLCSQMIFGCLEMLVLWNNYLTSLCSSYIDTLLRDYQSLTILNIGCNNLHDSFIADIKDALKQNQTIQRLGLQATNLTCMSAVDISEALRTNTTIERIDLRENCILFPGVRALSECLDVNKNLIQIDLNETTSGKNSEEYHALVLEISAKCLHNKENASAIAETETPRLVTPKGNCRKISLTCQTLTHQLFDNSPLLSEPKKAIGKLRSPAPSPAPSPIPSPVSSPVPPPITKSRFSVSRVAESKCASIQSRFTVLTVSEPAMSPKPVTTSSGPATVGFDCITTVVRPTEPPPAPPNSPKSLNGCNVDQLNESAAAENETSTCGCMKPSEPKPMSSIEKLLSIFQAPTNLFSKSSSPSLVTTKQCDNVKHLPFANVNKNVNSSTNVYSDSPNSKSESVKENISPEHSLTLSSVKKVSKNEFNSSCALDNKDVKNDSVSDDHGGNSTKPHAPLPLCSSSEDSDSGLATFEFCTDSGSMISDDSVASSENNPSTPSVQSPSSESEHSDVTNNNKWRPSVSVTVTSIDSNTDQN